MDYQTALEDLKHTCWVRGIEVTDKDTVKSLEKKLALDNVERAKKRKKLAPTRDSKGRFIKR